MKPLHSWNVTPDQATRLQERLRERLIIENGFPGIKRIGGADVGYSRDGSRLLGTMVVLSFPEMELLDVATSFGKVPFSYVPGLLSFREGPILIETFKKLRVKPDAMIFEGQGIAHPRGFGIASHLGLWLNLRSIGCTKNPLVKNFLPLALWRGSFEWIQEDGKRVGAVLRTRERVKPVFVSPGYRIDLNTSIEIILAACPKFRIPEPLRQAHRLTRLIA